jgi:DNA repair protein RadD
VIELREYQEESVAAVFDYFSTRPGNCVLSLPTGSGKSIVQAELLRRALAAYPAERFLLVTHVRELLQQNHDRLLDVWPEAPVGLYSAGLKHRDVRQITIAGIQSIYKRPALVGDVGLVIVDECHLVPRSGTGMYLSLLEGLKRTNPSLRVLGLTATPYRLDSGPLVEGEDSIFNGVAYEADILALVEQGYLSRLRNRIGATRADLHKVHVRGGDFVESELESIMDAEALVDAVANEVVPLLADRRKWLIFCCGVTHAAHVARVLNERGVATGCVTGETPGDERDAILSRFDTGQLRALTNCNVLTTGFDQPDIDAIVMLRPTLSTGLYVQQCGRGMRTADGKTDCLVLDYAGNVMRHGPVTRPIVNQKGGGGEAVLKECPECHDVIPGGCTICPQCGYVFLQREVVHQHHITHDVEHDIMGTDNLVTATVEFVEYERHEKFGRPDSMRVTYHCRTTEGRHRSYDEYVCPEHPGYAGEKGRRWLATRGARGAITVGAGLAASESLRTPAEIIVDTSERWPRIITCRGLAGVPLSDR